MGYERGDGECEILYVGYINACATITRTKDIF